MEIMGACTPDVFEVLCADDFEALCLDVIEALCADMTGAYTPDVFEALCADVCEALCADVFVRLGAFGSRVSRQFLGLISLRCFLPWRLWVLGDLPTSGAHLFELCLNVYSCLYIFHYV